VRDENAPSKFQTVSTAILHDIHFWVPVVVLACGLVVLRWIS
jgi:hypothetical protein